MEKLKELQEALQLLKEKGIRKIPVTNVLNDINDIILELKK